jgi:hypothetical protein
VPILEYHVLGAAPADEPYPDLYVSRPDFHRQMNWLDQRYPAGRFDSTVIAAVEAAGYAGATTEIRGYATRQHPYELDRFEILGSEGVAGLAADLG